MPDELKAERNTYRLTRDLYMGRLAYRFGLHVFHSKHTYNLGITRDDGTAAHFSRRVSDVRHDLSQVNYASGY
jgi:hypothetical protein